MFFYRRIRFTAVVAASAMAVEVSGNVKWSGSVANNDYGWIDGDNHTLGVKNGDVKIITSNSPEASVTFAGENAGAQFKIELGQLYGDDDNGVPELKDAALASTAAIWFAPIDALKVTVGNGLGLDAYGYGKLSSGDFVCDFTAIDGLTISAGIDGDFITIAKGSNDVKWGGAIGLKAAYSADFGNIALAARIADKKASEDDNKGIAIGAGYNGKTADVSYEVAAEVNLKSDAVISAKASVGYSTDAFGANAAVNFGFDTGKKEKAATSLDVSADASYKFGPASAKLAVVTSDLIEDNFTVQIEPSFNVSGTVGAVDCSIGATVDVGINFVKDADADVVFGFGIPVSFSVAL